MNTMNIKMKVYEKPTFTKTQFIVSNAMADAVSSYEYDTPWGVIVTSSDPWGSACDCSTDVCDCSTGC